MARRKKGNPVHGWVAIDKPVGMTSTQVVAKVRWLFQAQKAGHGGTLDPLATGLLPVALGEATKTVPYVMDGAKVYSFAIVWGEQRTTDDEEGEVCARSDVRPSEEQIRAALPAFIGAISQVPPRYSAIKVDGQRAYDLARDGEEVDLKARIIRIDDFSLVEMLPDRARFRVLSGKGAYMRSLARDLAQAVGTVGYIAELRRISCGPFAVDAAISLDKLAELGHSSAPLEALLPIKTALDDIPALAVSETEARRLANGQTLPLGGGAGRFSHLDLAEGTVVCVGTAEKLVAIARIEDQEIRPIRVLNL
jgi:tRNA pseudouridine55 synthase